MCYTAYMIITVDTGGTKTLIESFDENGAITYLDKFPTPRDVNEYVTRVTQTITDKTSPGSVEAISIAAPGPIKGDLLIRSANIGWENVDLPSLFRVHFPSTRIFFANDAELAALAETRALDTTPTTSLYVTLSTGIGTGLCHNGKLSDATSVLEGGHMLLSYDGKLQQWEDFASGRNFRDRYNQYGSEVDDPEKWRDYAERAAVGFYALIPLLKPDRVIIGGSMGTHFHKYGDFLNETLNRTLPEHMTYTTVSPAQHPEEAVIYGCYYYALDKLAR